MRKLMSLLILVGLLALSTTPVLAHGGVDDGDIDAPTLIRQAVAYFEGTKDLKAINQRIDEALEQDSEDVDSKLVVQAKEAITKKDLTVAKVLLVKALGKEPAKVLAIHPKFGLTGANIALLGIAAVLVLLGAVVVFTVKPQVRQEVR